jgi:hypothetical protein
MTTDTKSICRYILKETDDYTSFEIKSCLDSLRTGEIKSYKNVFGVDVLERNDFFCNKACYKTFIETITNKKAIASVKRTYWSPKQSSPYKTKNYNEENIIEITINDSSDILSFCEAHEPHDDIIVRDESSKGFKRESKKLYIITSDKSFNPEDFINDYSENVNFVTSNLDSSGYGVYTTATNEELLNYGDFGKHKYYDTCDKSTPCCDNCSIYAIGNCITINSCKWIFSDGMYDLVCSDEHKCSEAYPMSIDILPTEFYNSDLNSDKRKIWKKLINESKTIKESSKKNLFIPELNQCLWFECIPNSLNDPCKKYGKC